MQEAGRQMWPDKHDVTRKISQSLLHNSMIIFLKEKEVGWSKEMVLSLAKPFLKQLGDVL